MARFFAVGMVVMALSAGTALAGEPRDGVTKSNAPPTLRTQPPAQPEVRAQPDIRLPPRMASICAGASADLAVVCAEYERLYRQTEMQRIDTAKRLQALTRGGVVESLQ